MSTYADKIASLNQRLSELGTKLVELEQRRRDHSLDASQGNKTALQAIARLDTETEQVQREQKTLAAALNQTEQLAKDEQQQLLDKQEQQRLKEARELAGAAASYNDEVDGLLVKLREALERRTETLQQLSRLDVVDRGLVNRMLTKDPLTRALHHHAIHRYAAIMVGAPTSAAPMNQANKLLAGFGGGYIEPGKVARVKLNE